MHIEIGEMRYAHCEGHTDLCYDDDGKYIFTCGADGDVRIWNGFEDDNPTTYHTGEYCHAISFKKGQLYVANDTNAIQAYNFPSMTPNGIVTRFTSQINSMCCSKNGKFLLAGAGDFTIKAVDTTNCTQNIFEGHTAPILSISLDPQECFIASSSCDGTVCIWKFSDQTCVKIMNLIPKSSDFCLSETLCRLNWHPIKGNFLAIPVDKEIHLYQRHSWNLMISLKCDVSELISIVAFSHCGNLIAASSIDGYVFIWELGSFTCLQKFKHENSITICGLVWNPTNSKQLALCDTQGQLGIIENSALVWNPTNKQQLEIIENSALIEDKNSDFEDGNIIKNINNDEQLSQHSLLQNSKMTNDDNDCDIDIGAIKASLEPKIFGSQEIDDDETKLSTEAVIPTQIPSGPAPTPLQQAFQPASTPVHWDHRFMVWNNIGIVKCYNTEEENSIDVEFHDTSMHHAIHLTNSYNHTMASLSAEGLLLACPKDDTNSSQIICMHFDTWDSNKEWSADMPEDENIEAITIGSNWLAVATSMRLIRLFSIGGIQLEIFSIPGPVVCMIAYNKTLAIIYHQGFGIPGDQNLMMMLYSINCKKQLFLNPIPLSLSPMSMLFWAGFTDEGTVCTVDTSGIVRLLNFSLGNKWLPVANTKSHAKGKSDHYFVIGITEIQQTIRCIPCKGSRYPPTLPRPAVTVLPFQLPLCERQTDKGRYEEEFWRITFLDKLLQQLCKDGFDVESEIENVDKKKTDILLRMFALATRGGREFRALEVAELMPSHRIVEGAIRYASQRHHLALADRLGQIAQQKLQDEIEITENEEEMIEVTEWNNVQNIETKNNRKLSRSIVEDDVLQPKPLVKSDSKQKQETVDQSLDCQDDNSNQIEKNEDLSESVQKNPFKVQVQKRLSGIGIDNILENVIKKNTKSSDDNQKKSKSSKQMKLFPEKEITESKEIPKTAKQSGFLKYLEENKKVLSEENPELDENEIVKLAIQNFRKLLPEEKLNWTTKRKNDQQDDDHKNSKKKMKSINGLSNDTATKLSKFSFLKQK